VLHLEAFSTGRTPFSILPRAHSDIVAYIRNMVYFWKRYPEVELSPILKSLLAYRLNDVSQCWELRRNRNRLGGQYANELGATLLEMEEWLAVHTSRDARPLDNT
jgi:hypothetical protein